MLTIDISNRQERLPIQTRPWRRLVEHVLLEEGFTNAEISIAVVDDAEMHELNRRYLNHDYPTDVLSFVWECTGDDVSGEIIVSADTAMKSATEFRWTATEEITLYVLHGLLHLVGYDDHEPSDRQAMRQLEDHYLRQLGWNLPVRSEI